MTTRIISKETELQGIKLWLQGETRDEIASRTGISEGKVSKIIAAFQDTLKATGWSEDLIIYERETMKRMKSKGIGFDQVAKALRVDAVLEKAGLSEDALTFVQLLSDAAKNQDIEPLLLEKLLHGAKDLFAERDPNGSITTFYTPAQVLERIKGISEVNERLRSEHVSFAAKVQQKNTEFAQLTSRFRSKELEFRIFSDASRRLAAAGISIEDLDKLSNLMSNAKEQKMDL